MATQLDQQDRDALQQALAAAFRHDIAIAPKLYANDGGEEITPELRDALLEKCAAGAYVSLTLSVLAFEQKAGQANRNFLRFRDASLRALGSSGNGKPFLRDHNKYETSACIGTILKSKTEQTGSGDYAIRMTVELTDPAAVAQALRGQLKSVSIGWYPTGPVECSVCQAAVNECWHYPGQKLAESITNGQKSYVRDRKGALTVEWVYTSAELTECSVVNVPAVPSAGIEGVRAALSAAGIDLHDKSTRTNAVPEPALTPMEPIMTTPTIVVLSDAQLAHHNKLSPTEQAAFAAKSFAERDAIVAAALNADAPIWTGKLTKVVVRKSDGALALQLAEQNEKNAEELAAQRAETARVNELHASQVLATRANNEIGNLAGTPAVKVAMLRALEGITDEATRTAALEILRGCDARMKELAAPKGANPGTDPKVLGAAEKIEALAVKYAADHKCSLDDARALIYETPDGAALYAEMHKARRQATA